MTLPIVFPDTSATVASLLATGLTVDTGVYVPNPRPAEFIVVRRVGGVSRDEVIDDATIVVEAWSDTEEAAHDLSQLARAHLHAAVGAAVDGVRIFRVREFAGPASLPDPLSSQPRYTFTASVTVRGATSGS